MKRLEVLGIVLWLLMTVTGTASAQDAGPQPFPEGSHLLFISHLARYNELVPGFIREQGPCEASGNCPGHPGFQAGKVSAWSVNGRFDYSPQVTAFKPARRMSDRVPEVSLLAVCFVPNCLFGFTTPEVHTAEINSQNDLRYLEFQDPPAVADMMPESEFTQKLANWIDNRQDDMPPSQVPADFPIQRISLAGYLPMCDQTPWLPALEGAVATAQFRMTGIIMCWDGTKYNPGVVLNWIGHDGIVNDGFADRMVYRWAYVISFDDFLKDRNKITFAQKELSYVYNDIAQTPVDEWQLPVPDWGKMGVFAETAAAVGAGAGLWFGTRVEPALNTALGSFWLFVLPQEAICPMADLRDGNIPRVACGAVIINQ